MNKTDELYLITKESENKFKQWLFDYENDPETKRNTYEIVNQLKEIIWNDADLLPAEKMESKLIFICLGFCFSELQKRHYH